MLRCALQNITQAPQLLNVSDATQQNIMVIINRTSLPHISGEILPPPQDPLEPN